MRTIGHRLTGSQGKPGDYRTRCDWCGAAAYRSDLISDGTSVYHPWHKGRSERQLNEANAAAEARRVPMEFERDLGAGWSPVELELDTPAIDDFEAFERTDVKNEVVMLTEIVFTFNKPMSGGRGYVKLYTAANELVQAWFALDEGTFATTTVDGSEVHTATFEVTEAYSSGTHYVQVDETAFEDAQHVLFAGVSDPDTLTFEVL